MSVHYSSPVRVRFFEPLASQQNEMWVVEKIQGLLEVKALTPLRGVPATSKEEASVPRSPKRGSSSSSVRAFSPPPKTDTPPWRSSSPVEEVQSRLYRYLSPLS